MSAPRNALERPSGACLTCTPPLGTRSWKRAHDGYRTCDMCLDRLRETLRDIADRYNRLDPTPGSSTEHGSRGAPGFGSKPTASLHIIAMQDPRSSAEAHVWVGGDGRVHRESERPPLSVFSVLETEAFDVAELRGYDNPVCTSVADLARWLDSQLDWITKQDFVAEFAESLRELQSQLRPLTGDKRNQIGKCPNVLDEGEHTRECSSPLYAPTENAKDDTIRCRGCGRTWPRPEWIQLGLLLKAA